MTFKYIYPWHTDTCKARSTTKSYFNPQNGFIHFFCETHGQWTVEPPIKEERIYTYTDGKTVRIIK